MLVKIIVSSLLILGVLGIRFVFQNKVSPIWIYMLWLPVAVRLLMPGMPIDSPLSIMHTEIWERVSSVLAEEDSRQQTAYKDKRYQEYYENILAKTEETGELEETGKIGQVEETKGIEKTEQMVGPEGAEKIEELKEPEGAEKIEVLEEPGKKNTEPLTTDYELQLKSANTLFDRIRRTAFIIWVTGMVLISFLFIRKNLSFYRYLRKERRRISPEDFCGDAEESIYSPIPVFAVKNKLDSPCLFGLFPAVYIPEEVLCSDTLPFILTHELTHYRHGDQIWGLVRILCLIVNWYNPLVWIGARLSLRDGELACDAGCIRRLGEEKRFAYGEVLLSLVKPVKERKFFSEQGIMMGAEKKFMKKRIEWITGSRKGNAAFAVILLMLALLCVGGTCTGKRADEAGEMSGTAQTAEL